MKTKRLLILSILSLGLALTSWGQDFTQTIRGKVVDQQSQTPLPGVNVFLINAQPPVGTTTDMDGYFSLENVSVGRVNIGFSFIGYEPVALQNIEVSSSKELVLNISMLESVNQLAEVQVTAEQDKERPKNERVNVSGRTFSIEESQRFAGSFQDVSRMASNFAGVQRTDDSNNDIVIRGNSPIGLIWRLEGIDIPNPNHFGGLGATGGPVSMLNNNVLANSDFLTGAFPSEFGDGLSGVFDLGIRNGNYEKHEFLGQIGFNGFEGGAEGPINRENKSSYLVNYRYSTLGVLSAMGINFGTGTAVPQYQDLSFKLHFPSRKYGTIDVFGLGGFSSIHFEAQEEPDEEDFFTDGEDLKNRVRNGVIGASHQYFYNKDLYSKVTVAFSGIGTFTDIDTLNAGRTSLFPQYRQNFEQSDLQVSALINKKFNVRHVLRVGAFVTHKSYDLADSSQFFDGNLGIFEGFRILRSQKSTDVLVQPYANWQYRITDQWEMNLGLHAMFLQSNSTSSIEPRFGLSYKIDDKKSLNLGYGLHSQVAQPTLLYNQNRTDDGSFVSPNTNLDFTRSHHIVLGYDQMFANRIHFKAETYYQFITDAIVEASPSPFSALNAGSFSFGAPDSLTNEGTGYNYGLDLTLEKFLDKGFYFLTTVSLYESKYEGSDGIERSTAFNGNYVLNVLGGKEFVLNKNKSSKYRHTLTLDGKVTLAGGQRFTPYVNENNALPIVDEFDDSRAFEGQYDPYFRPDIRIGYKRAGKKITQEWAFDIQNFINRQNVLGRRYNGSTGEVETTSQLGLFPMVLYRITF